MNRAVRKVFALGLAIAALLIGARGAMVTAFAANDTADAKAVALPPVQLAPAHAPSTEPTAAPAPARAPVAASVNSAPTKMAAPSAVQPAVAATAAVRPAPIPVAPEGPIPIAAPVAAAST